MNQWVRTSAAKSGDLSLVLWTHMVKGKEMYFFKRKKKLKEVFITRQS